MSAMPVASATLRERVAEEVRAALARKRMSAAKLARHMGVSQTYIWRRLNAETAFDMDDLEHIGRVLGIAWMALLPQEPSAWKVPPNRSPRDNRPPSRPVPARTARRQPNRGRSEVVASHATVRPQRTDRHPMMAPQRTAA